MIRKGKGFVTFWNAMLLFSVVFAAFILPVFPDNWHRGGFRLVYTLIYLSGIFSLEKRPRAMIALVIMTFVIEWLSSFFDLDLLMNLAKGSNMLFFLIMVIMLIKQVAIAREVNAEIILGSIVGYILLGVVYSIFVTLIMQNDPGAFNCQLQQPVESELSMADTSLPLYYSFVTMGTLGYGDILPLKPYTRALATWITVSGQLYLAVIIALLVGKFSARKSLDE